MLRLWLVMAKHPTRQYGFTIIEVLIVLAIAGLILLIIFFAIPEAKRIQRNNARKNAVAHIVAELNNYYTNRGRFPYSGNLPGQDSRPAFISFIATEGSTRDYEIRYTDNGSSHEYPFMGVGATDPQSTVDEITILPAHKCNRDPDVGPGDIDYPAQSTSLGDMNFNTFAVWTVLERAPVFCLDVEG